jgi:DNA primase
LLYGNEEVDFIEETTILDDDGKESISSRKYQNLVSSEIYLHLQDDEIEFSNDIFQEIYNEMIHQLNQSQKLITDAFINHQNSNISNTVTSILMDEEKHLLSNWESKNIEVKSSLEVLRKSVNDAVFNLRRILIGKKIEDLIKESISQNSNTVNLDLVKSYTGLKMRLFSKLNRVV